LRPPGVVAPDLYKWYGSYMSDITVSEAREHLADVIEEARRKHEPVYLYRRGKRLVAIIDAEDLDRLVEHLIEAEAQVVICDVSASAVGEVCARHPEVRAVDDIGALIAEELDILAPCALGGTLTEQVVNALTARIVCGAANNQLAHHGVEKLLADRGILYAPDYVVNAGGVIQVADELAGFNFERAHAATEQIFATTAKVLQVADSDGVPPSVAADRLAERRMSDVGRLRGIWLGTMGSA